MTGNRAAPDTGQEADAPGVRVDVIGAGAVRRGDAAVTGLDLGGRRARVALGALALAGGPVPADRLAALIWSNAPPATWPVALRGVISSLRAALEAWRPTGSGSSSPRRPATAWRPASPLTWTRGGGPGRGGRPGHARQA